MAFAVNPPPRAIPQTDLIQTTQTQTQSEPEKEAKKGTKKGTKKKDKKKEMSKSQQVNRKQERRPRKESGSIPMLKSGMRSHTYFDQTLQDNRALFDLVMTSGKFDLTGIHSEGSDVSDYFEQQIFPAWYSTAQSNVNFNIDTVFTVDSLRQYFDTVFEALQLYYFIDARLNYKATGMQDSIAAITYYNLISDPNLLYLFDDLKQAIIGKICPPNALKFIQWAFQYYKYSEVDNSPIIALSYEDSMLYKIGTVNQGIAHVPDIQAKVRNSITRLTTTSFLKLAGIIRKTRESWLINDPDLAPSRNRPVYDPQFVNLFINMPGVSHSQSDGTGPLAYYPYTNSDGSFYYATISGEDELDGVVYASTTIQDTSNGNQVLRPGLWWVDIQSVPVGYTSDSFNNGRYYNNNMFYSYVLNDDQQSYWARNLFPNASGDPFTYNSTKFWGSPFVNKFAYWFNSTTEVSDKVDLQSSPQHGNIVAIHSIDNLKQATREAMWWLHNLSEVELIKKNFT